MGLPHGHYDELKDEHVNQAIANQNSSLEFYTHEGDIAEVGAKSCLSVLE